MTHRWAERVERECATVELVEPQGEVGPQGNRSFWSVAPLSFLVLRAASWRCSPHIRRSQNDRIGAITTIGVRASSAQWGTVIGPYVRERYFEPVAAATQNREPGLASEDPFVSSAACQASKSSANREARMLSDPNKENGVVVPLPPA